MLVDSHRRTGSQNCEVKRAKRSGKLSAVGFVRPNAGIAGMVVRYFKGTTLRNRPKASMERTRSWMLVTVLSLVRREERA